MTLRERGSGVKRAKDPSDIRGGKALATAVDVDFSPALRAAVRRAGARGRTEDAQELAVPADGVGRNFHYCGLPGGSRSLNLSLSAHERCKSVCVGEHATYFQGAEVRLAAGLLFAAQHLDNLRRLELQLVGPAAELVGPPPEKRASYPRPGCTRRWSRPSPP